MPPFSQWLFANPYGDGDDLVVGIIGGSFGFEYTELWAFEVGGVLVGSPVAQTTEGFVRGGIAPMLWDDRERNGRGWTVQMDLLAGYRYLVWSKSRDGHEGEQSTHGARANIGLDMTAHGESFDLLLRVLSGITVPLSQRRTGAWRDYSYNFHPEDDLRTAFDIGFDIGIAR